MFYTWTHYYHRFFCTTFDCPWFGIVLSKAFCIRMIDWHIYIRKFWAVLSNVYVIGKKFNSVLSKRNIQFYNVFLAFSLAADYFINLLLNKFEYFVIETCDPITLNLLHVYMHVNIIKCLISLKNLHFNKQIYWESRKTQKLRRKSGWIWLSPIKNWNPDIAHYRYMVNGHGQIVKRICQKISPSKCFFSEIFFPIVSISA